MSERRRVRTKREQRRPRLFERLEQRLYLTVYYDLDVIASTPFESTLEYLNPPAINGSGNLAFVAGRHPNMGDIYAANDGGTYFVAQAADGNSASFGVYYQVDFNDAGEIVAQDQTVVGGELSGGRFTIHTFDANLAKDPALVATTGEIDEGQPYKELGFFPAINNDGTIVFSGNQEGFVPENQGPIVVAAHARGNAGNENEIIAMYPSTSAAVLIRPRISDTGRIVARTGPGSDTAIELLENGSSVIIADAANGFTGLGLNPGIAADGSTIVFFGEVSAEAANASRLNPGPGIFAAQQRGGFWTIDRVAGEGGNGYLDPGETFEDSNDDGLLNNGEVDLGPFTAFEPHQRVTVTSMQSQLGSVTIAYLADASGWNSGPVGQALFTSELVFGIDPDTGDFNVDPNANVTANAPSRVVGVGDQVAGLAGTVSQIKINDPLNDAGQVGLWVETTTGTQSILKGSPIRTPVLIVPGIVGSFIPEDGDYIYWLTHRGVNPETLVLDPILNVYDDLVETLTRSGYQLGRDLVKAPYDWRLPVAPRDEIFDGLVTDVTPASMSDDVFEYGLDYLGYWMKKAIANWRDAHNLNVDPPSIDIVAHSMGGLVARSYLQSSAYAQGGLPRVDRFVSLSSPHLGASKSWNPVHDNWIADLSYRFFLSKMLEAAYIKLTKGGITIEGPKPITLESISDENDVEDPRKFIEAYAPALWDLLPIYDFLRPHNAQTNAPEEFTVNVNDDPSSPRNLLLLDLNVGRGTGSGDSRSFTTKTNATILNGGGVDTFSEVKEWRGRGVGPDDDGLNIFSVEISQFVDFIGRSPRTGETWYEDIDNSGQGDGTVPEKSLSFAEQDQRVPRQLQANGADHLSMVADTRVQQAVLDVLSARRDGEISTDLQSSLLGTFFTPRKWPRLLETVASQLPIVQGIWLFLFDPVQSVVRDGDGRRVGYDPTLGQLKEIHNSIYFGREDGIGWIFGEVTTPITVDLTSVGSQHLVKLDGIQRDGTVSLLEFGLLDAGTSLSIPVQFDPFTADGTFDFGDAPTSSQTGFASSYPTTLQEDGARHDSSSLYLGANIDFEADGDPSNEAGLNDVGGDNGTDLIDEDGVAMVSSLIVAASSDTTASFAVTASSVGILDGWADFNRDGDWNDPDEKIFSSVNVVQGVNGLGFTIPSTATADHTAFRFRLSSVGVAGPTGEAPDGEVEDYYLSITRGDVGQRASVEFNLFGAPVVLMATEDSIRIRSSQTDLFQVPQVSVQALAIKGTEEEDAITIKVEPGFSLPQGGLTLDGVAGSNRLMLTGDQGVFDLTSSSTTVNNFEHIDLSGGDETQLILNAAAISGLSPLTNVVSVTAGEGDKFRFTDAEQWRMQEPVDRNGRFVLVASIDGNGQEAAQTVEADWPHAWQNFVRNGDVNNDGGVTASDALRIINELAARAFSDRDTSSLKEPKLVGEWPGVYFDQNGDDRSTALDALRVINEIALIVNQPATESELIAPAVIASKRTENVEEPDHEPISELSARGSLGAQLPGDPAPTITSVASPLRTIQPRPERSVQAVDQLLADSFFLNELTADIQDPRYQARPSQFDERGYKLEAKGAKPAIKRLHLVAFN